MDILGLGLEDIYITQRCEKLAFFLEERNDMPQEIIGGRRTQVAIYLALNKKLIANIASIRKVLTVTIYANARNCYNRVAHPFMSLYSQFFRLDVLCLIILFRII